MLNPCLQWTARVSNSCQAALVQARVVQRILLSVASITAGLSDIEYLHSASSGSCTCSFAALPQVLCRHREEEVVENDLKV